MLDGAFPEYAAYLDDAVARRRGAANPPDDLITALSRQELSGAPASARQIRSLLSNLILGGISTSTSMLGNLLHQLLASPDDHRVLHDDPARVSAAVEESLRIHPPILYVPRTCTADTAIGGHAVQAGERVIVSLASANRDPSVFQDPDRFRLDRDGAWPHLSFAPGAHLCVGAGLARATGRRVVEAFVSEFAPGQMTLAQGFAFQPTPVFMEYGPSALPVQVDPA